MQQKLKLRGLSVFQLETSEIQIQRGGLNLLVAGAMGASFYFITTTMLATISAIIHMKNHDKKTQGPKENEHSYR